MVGDGREPSREPPGNGRVLALALGAFSLGFGIWAMFSALGPFLIDWYAFSPGQVMFLAAMEPLGAMALSLPLGVATDRFGGRVVFSALLLLLSLALLLGLVVESYAGFLLMGLALGLGGASFVVGNAHVSAWYPKARQGAALGLFALGNAGIVLGLVVVPLSIEHLFGGPVSYADLPARFVVGPIEGWRLIFLLFAAPSLVMAVVYWVFTSEPPGRTQHLSMREIVGVYRSSRLAWIVAYLYWVSFGTLTFFAASTPTYLTDRWDVSAARAAMVFTAALVVCVALMRPVGGWLADRHDPLRLMTAFFAASSGLAVVIVFETSLAVQLIAFSLLALASGAAASCVMKLIPMYFDEVGAVSGLAKSAGAACGFTMTSLMALSTDLFGSFVPAFAIWAGMNAAALWIVGTRQGMPLHGAARKTSAGATGSPPLPQGADASVL